MRAEVTDIESIDALAEGETTRLTVRGVIPSAIADDEAKSSLLFETPDAVVADGGINSSVGEVYGDLVDFWSKVARVLAPGATLEVVDCYLPLQMLSSPAFEDIAPRTIRYKYTEAFIERPDRTVPHLGVRRGPPLPVDRLIVDYGAYVDCENLSVAQLVLYNLACAKNINAAKRIDSLVIVHPHNPMEDSETQHPESGYMFPSPPGLTRIVIPESQEFRYAVRETVIPDIVGIIPSRDYPSRFSQGLKMAREPFETSRITGDVLNVLESDISY